MKVLHLISSGGMYGAEAVILNLSRALEQDSHRSILAVFANSTNPNLQLHEAAQQQGIESHPIACKGQLDRSAIRAIHHLATQIGADVIHAHGFKADIYAFLALRKRRIPLVSTCHTWYDTSFLVSFYGKLDRAVLRSYARVVAVSEEVRQRLLKAGVHDSNILKIRNGIDLHPFARPIPSPDTAIQPNRELVVGLVGRLAWEKGIDILLAAAAKVIPQFPTVRFVIAGEGPDHEALQQTIHSLNLSNQVTLAGRRNDMPAVYASFDIMVSSSRQEGLPIAILEGMATGLPLVATAVGEVPTVVINNTTGLLIPAENPDRLAAAILELLRDPAKRACLGTAARQLIATDYSAERMTTEYLHIYEQAIQQVRNK
ncbi:MAG TPA: glycosyltransferase family 4 protein [Acidobacteriaceae bacterium]|nr:glycosyltransferase family 4 protein [Acidobacteriaceae bacterium]